MAVLLGIDVGTTAVKCALVDAATRAPLASASEDTSAYAAAAAVATTGCMEQHVDAIFAAVTRAVAALPQELLAQISSIGICGQMHGIVWWRAAAVAQAARAVLSSDGLNTVALHPPAWSRLVTWEDQRCSEAFLSELQMQIEVANKLAPDGGEPPAPLSSGFGLATYAHALQTNPASLAGFDACGTIQDLLAFVLCGLDSPTQATIDTTNAASWGCFERESSTWNRLSLSCLGIPDAALPTVVKPGCVIGQTTDASGFGVPANVSVFVPMGDHPCSVVAATAQSDDTPSSGVHTRSLVNIGTSAQLAMVLPADTASRAAVSSRGFEIRPYIDDFQVLGVAAALSGGNMVAWFTQRWQEWTHELTGVHVDESILYERFVSLGLQKTDTKLQFRPTLNGERATPHQTGCIDALRLHNGSLGDLSAALCRGLIQNLVEMVPPDLRSHLRTSSLVGTGNALLRNKLLQHFLVYELADAAQLRLEDAADAAVGAALVPTVLGVIP